MSDSGPGPETLTHVEEVAALGCLLNAVAHDLNNQLTNLMLGADQAQYTGSKDAIDLMVKQAQNIVSITRAVQHLGQRNMGSGLERVDLCAAVEAFGRWYRATTPGAASPQVTDDGTGPAVSSRTHNVVLALTFLVRSGGADPATPLHVSVSTEEVPRSSWAGNTETVPMGVVRLRRGDPPDEKNSKIASIVDDFFVGERTQEQVCVMAAWEILRKVRGRPSARLEVRGADDDAGQEISILLPLAAE